MMRLLPFYKFLFISLFVIIFCAVGGERSFGDEKKADKIMQEVEEYKVLSVHETEAVFKGFGMRKCHFLTAECPNHCNHGGPFGKFEITRYLKYKKYGKYGDPKRKELVVMLKPELMEEDIVEKIKLLKVGDSVLLTWEHRYITRTDKDGSSASFPRRVITRLTKLPLATETKGKKDESDKKQ